MSIPRTPLLLKSPSSRADHKSDDLNTVGIPASMSLVAAEPAESRFAVFDPDLDDYFKYRVLGGHTPIIAAERRFQFDQFMSALHTY